MADEVQNKTTSVSLRQDVSSSREDLILPPGWMYKRIKIGPFSTPWYASPKIQLGMVAIVCLLCPGMFNALSGMGGAGMVDPHLSDRMNVALYTTFAVVGFFAGTVVNYVGIRYTVPLGGFGYCIYSISLLVSKHARVDAFNIVAGVLVGICAGLLWSSQGLIMMSYPTEAQKGRYWAWFWSVFNIGGCIGSLVLLGQNVNVKSNQTVTDGTYVAFIVLMFVGGVVAFFMCDAENVVRSDGSRVILKQNPSFISEMIGLYETVAAEPLVILLFPMFWSSNFFYPYQQNTVNGANFSTRTKALNNFLYWFFQIVAAVLLGPLLDYGSVRRSVRARIALAFLFVLTWAVWGGGYAWQKDVKGNTIDWTTRGYAGPMFLYLFYGFFDGAWQGITYWFIGALGNSGRKLANLAGFFKGLQAAGSALSYHLNDHAIPPMNEFASNWGLVVGSLVVAAPLVILRIKDHVPIEEDLAGTGETVADVVPVGISEEHLNADKRSVSEKNSAPAGNIA